MNTQDLSQQLSHSSRKTHPPAGRKIRYGLILLLAGSFILAWSLVPVAQAQAPAEPLHADAGDETTQKAKASSEDPADANRISLNITSTAWRANIGKQSARNLRSPSETVRAATLQNIVFFATHNGDELDFSKTVPALLDIYRGDENKNLRIMALAALHAIDDGGSMQQLAAHLGQERSTYVPRAEREQTERLRRLTIAVLADHLKKQRAK